MAEARIHLNGSPWVQSCASFRESITQITIVSSIVTVCNNNLLLASVHRLQKGNEILHELSEYANKSGYARGTKESR